MKKTFSSFFFINSTQYTDSVRNLCSKGYSLLKKNTCPRFLGTRNQVLTQLTQKKSVLGTEAPELQKLLVEKNINHHSNLYICQILIFRLGRGRSGFTN